MKDLAGGCCSQPIPSLPDRRHCWLRKARLASGACAATSGCFTPYSTAAQEAGCLPAAMLLLRLKASCPAAVVPPRRGLLLPHALGAAAAAWCPAGARVLRWGLGAWCCTDGVGVDDLLLHQCHQCCCCQVAGPPWPAAAATSYLEGGLV
jgi:hypothetical protein